MEQLKEGQGATEYLVLLAVVLIVALVSIALLGFFPGLATDAKITQSAAYWKSARPFAILEHKVAGSNGYSTLVLQNLDVSGTYTLTAVQLGGNTNATSATFAPGEMKAITATAPTGPSGAIYDLNVTLNYTTPNSVAGRFFSAKNLIGRYS